jgi:hypothetical protein
VGDSVAGSAPPAGSVPAHTPEQLGGACSNCGAAMAPGQDWCLQCGAGAPGSIGTPSWRSAALVLGATAVLVLGAVAAAYAALTKDTTPPTHMLTTTVAQVTPTVPATTPVTPPTIQTPTTVAPLPLPLPKGTAPKIPITPTVTPKSTIFPPAPKATTTPTTPTTTTTPASTGGANSQSEPIVLDTNAASTYNPYNYPAANFGDPSLAIDGDTSTSWDAQVNPATAPGMANGVLIDLKAHQKVASLTLITSTPGMTVQVYGTASQTAPTTITDPAWIALDTPRVVKKQHVKLKLKDSGKAFYYVMLWISKAPATSTPAAPGHVSVNEIELLPPA